MQKEISKIFIAQYRGIGPLSMGIEFFTRSKWSHSAIVIKYDDDDDGAFILYEAWGFKGVVKIEGHTLHEVLSKNHRPITMVDLYTIDLCYPRIDFLDKQVGKKYDWSLINKFVTRRPAMENDKWICSELVGEFCNRSGNPLQHMPTWKMAPEHVGISPVLEPHSVVRTI